MCAHMCMCVCTRVCVCVHIMSVHPDLIYRFNVISMNELLLRMSVENNCHSLLVNVQDA